MTETEQIKALQARVEELTKALREAEGAMGGILPPNLYNDISHSHSGVDKCYLVHHGEEGILKAKQALLTIRQALGQDRGEK